MKDDEKTVVSFEEGRRFAHGNIDIKRVLRSKVHDLSKAKRGELKKTAEKKLATQVKKKLVPRPATHQDLGLKTPGNLLGKNFKARSWFLHKLGL